MTLTIHDLRDTARTRGGACLSRAYRGVTAKYQWKCAAGHKWLAKGSNVRSGNWCPKCRQEPEPSNQGSKARAGQPGRKPGNSYTLTIQDLQAAAKSHKGLCLAKLYRGGLALYWWQCKENHQWEASAASVLYGRSWCPTCATRRRSKKRRLTIHDLHETAAEHFGECLSQRYRGVLANYRWRCEKGHEWEATAAGVRNGRWCPECASEEADQIRGSLRELRAAARARGGKCLSRSYHGSTAKYLWRCANGHEWEAIGRNVAVVGTWCLACARDQARVRLQQMHEELVAAGAIVTSDQAMVVELRAAHAKVTANIERYKGQEDQTLYREAKKLLRGIEKILNRPEFQGRAPQGAQ